MAKGVMILCIKKQYRRRHSLARPSGVNVQNNATPDQGGQQNRKHRTTLNIELETLVKKRLKSCTALTVLLFIATSGKKRAQEQKKTRKH